jgi:alpha-N-arabinofuranosidase
MSVRAVAQIDPVRRLGPIDPRVYGQFVEQLGRAVYGGVVEPGSRFADDTGVRLDVLDAARGLAPTVLRWPGGNFASGYHWRDGIGSPGDRPLRRDLAWSGLESNAFGTEEFLDYCRRLGAEPYLNLNASTGTIDEALSWVEYCNAVEPLPEAELRRAGPHPEPHGVKLFGIGNENYGWWQHGHSTAAEYAALAREWGKLLRWASPEAELIAVGAAEDMDWNWTVLSTAGRFVDFLSLHFYWHGDEAHPDPYHSVVTDPLASEQDIIATWGLALAAQRKLGLPRPVRLAIDEWNVWTRTNRSAQEDLGLHDMMRGGLTPRNGFDVRFEEDYDLKDALAVATWLHVMWRHPTKLGLATQSQMVNVIAPIHVHSDGVLKHTIYHPLALARAHAGTISLDVQVVCDAAVPAAKLVGGTAPVVDVAATARRDGSPCHVSIVNLSADDDVAVDLVGLAGEWNAALLWSEDVFDQNTIARPDAVVPEPRTFNLDDPVTVPRHGHLTLWRDDG